MPEIPLHLVNPCRFKDLPRTGMFQRVRMAVGRMQSGLISVLLKKLPEALPADIEKPLIRAPIQTEFRDAGACI
jgi:hypothetical protein